LTILGNSKGGVFSFISTLIPKLLEKNYCLKAIFLSGEANTRLSQSSMLEVDFLSFNLARSIRTLKGLFSNDSDIIHINFASFFPLVLLKKLMFKTPYVLTLHGLPQPSLEYGLKNKMLYTIETILVGYAARHSAATVCVSEYTRRLLKRLYHADSGVIYHGLEATKIHVTDKSVAKQQLGFQESDRIILFVGVLNPYKDPLTLIKAFSYVLNKQPANLVIVGKGELKPKAMQTATCLGIQNSTYFFESISEEKLGKFYNAADVFVLPTVNEAFGIVLLEAMAFGLPIVASDGGACMEVADEAALYFRQGNAQALADRILQLLGDTMLSDKLSRRGKSRVAEFTLEKVALQYSRLFEEVLSLRSR
jgi:glycosyltransferase involved in cell wall biosynthesis